MTTLLALRSSPTPPSHPPRRSDAEAAALVAAWQASGMRPSAWCQAQGVSRSALGSCRKRVAQAVGFVPVLPASGSVGVAMDLPEGIRITGLARAEVAAVVLARRLGGGR